MKKGVNPDIQLPAQDLSTLSFSKMDLAAIDEWLANLPIANLGATTRSLYTAIDETIRLKTAPQLRFDILEKLRPAIYFSCQGLEKHFINQPITLPEQAQKVADLAQALQSSLVEGYMLVAQQCQEKMLGFHIGKPTMLMAKALDRAFVDATRLLARNYQLHLPLEKHFWYRLHQLNLLGEQCKVSQHTVTDILQGTDYQSSPSASYIRLLLLGCVKANQLRQEDIVLIETPARLNHWAAVTELTEAQKDTQHLFIIDPHLDYPPNYQKFYSGDYNEDCRCLDTSRLVSLLHSELEQQPGDPQTLSKNLLNHLIAAWGVLTDRTFMRLEAQDKLALCVGLSTTHHHIAGDISFSQLIHGEDTGESDGKTLFPVDHKGDDRHDCWDDAFDSEKGADAWNTVFQATDDRDRAQQRTRISMESIEYHVRHDGTLGEEPITDQESGKEKYQYYDVQVVNMSPSGYCLDWPQKAPPHFKTGEITGIKETHHNNWSIAAIRWVNQENDQHLQIGVELLSPTATPYGARILQKKGTSSTNYVRVLVLPEITPINQPETIITPSLGFREGLKVLLAQNGHETTIQLTKQLTGGGSYSQFEFKEKKRIHEQKKEEQLRKQSEADNNFDSLWNNL